MIDYEKEIQRLVEALSIGGETLDKAISRALSRTIKTYAAKLARETAAETRLPLRPIRQRIRTSLRRGDMVANLSMIAYDLPLILAGARQTASGVRTRQGRVVEGAFIATSRYGRLARKVYRRRSKARHPLGAEGGEIKAAATSAVIDLEPNMRDVFLENLLHEVKYRGGLLG